MTSTNIGSIAPTVTVNGRKLTDKEQETLTLVNVDRGVNLIGRATLRFSDFGFPLAKSSTFELGAKVHVGLTDAKPLFDGTITGISLDQRRSSMPQLVVVADDAAYKLAYNTQITTYKNQSYPDVITKIAQRHGLTAEVDANSIVHEYLMQAGTDMDFLNSMTERLGYAWWVDGATKLKAKKIKVDSPSVTLTLHKDESLLEFGVRASAMRPTKLTVNGWDPKAQTNVTANTTDAPGPTPDLVSKYLGTQPASKLTESPASVSDHPALTAEEATMTAQSLLSQWAAAAVVAHGKTPVNHALAPGVTVAVKDAGPCNGNYLITAVEHTYDAAGFFSRFTAGPLRPAGLVDTLGNPAPDPGFTIPGLIVGKVSNTIDPNKQGRVTVKYTGINGEIETPFARIVTLGAGKDRGIVFDPEVDDEVLLGFEHGDTRRPVVLGGLYSEKAGLPAGSDEMVAGDGKVTYRRIQSRKKHLIEIADGEATTAQYIKLNLGTAAEHLVFLGAEKLEITVASGKPITIAAGDASFKISEAGDITLEANNINIKAKQNLTLQAEMNSSLKATQQLQAQGMQVQIQAQGTGNFTANGPLALKGAMVAIN